LPHTSPTADLRFPKMRSDHGNFSAMMDHRRNVTFNGLVIPLETFCPVRNHSGTLRNIISKMFAERCLFQILFWGEPSQRIISFQGYLCLCSFQSVVCLIKPSNIIRRGYLDLLYKSLYTLYTGLTLYSYFPLLLSSQYVSNALFTSCLYEAPPSESTLCSDWSAGSVCCDWSN